jgi:hypothetical protein
MTFDVDSFLSSTINEVNDTKIVNTPPGDYQATIGDVKVEPWNSRDGTKSGLKLLYNAAITDPAVVAVTGRTPTKVRGEIMLDLTESGSLDMSKGKNIRLGKLREAVGMNTAGRPFSFLALDGQMLMVKVGNRPNPEDSSIVYDEIKAVTKIGS